MLNIYSDKEQSYKNSIKKVIYIYYGNLCDICNVMKKELDKIRLPERIKA